MKPAPLRIRAAPLAPSRRRVSFLLMERSRRPATSLLARKRARPHDPAQAEDLRADPQAGALGGLMVDDETDQAVAHLDLQDAAGPREALRLAHRQDAPSTHAAEEAARILRSGGADEEDLAGTEIAGMTDALDLDRPSLHSLAGEEGVERRAERVLPDDGHDERRARIGERLRRPLDELGDGIDEVGLDLRRHLGWQIGVGRAGTRPDRGRESERHEEGRPERRPADPGRPSADAWSPQTPPPK